MADFIQFVETAPVFLVDDVGATLRWYSANLGFTARPFPDREPYVFGQALRDRVEIMFQRVEGFQLEDLASRRPGGVWHAYLRVKGVRALYEQVRARLPVRRPLRRQPYGESEFEIADLNGYILVFSEPLPENAAEPASPEPPEPRPEPLPVLIEPMTATDWPQVAAIYQEGIATGLATFETEVPSWETFDAGRHEFGRLVARTRDGRVAGWVVLSPTSSRPCYRGVAEITFYVAESARGRGVGHALVRAAVEASEAAGIWTLQGGTFAENLASLRLQLRCGFRLMARRRRVAQLNGIWKDTILTERRSPIVGAPRPPADG